MFISQAIAQTTDAAAVAATPDIWNMILQFALIVFILYFLLIRPQQKKIKQHEAALNSIQKGTKIVLAGIEGVVQEILPDNKLRVKIADSTSVVVLRGYVSQVISSTDEKK